MKHIYLVLSLFLTTTLFAQIPSGYYDSATGTGYTLKSQLEKIVNNQNDGLTTEFIAVDKGYSYLYTTYESSDRDKYYENNNTVLDMYSENPSGTDAYEYTYEIESPDDRDSGSGGTSEGEYYNREHIIPQSVFESQYPMRSDAHFVTPTDKHVNNKRASYPFGVVQSATFTSTNGSKLGNNLNSGYSAGYSSTVFEPIDEFKGDIARMHFYFVTRYEGLLDTFSAYDMFNGSTDQSFELAFLNILYQWHIQDPVSQREIDRNNAIFNEQNNRNPFIDHPEYVLSIWGSLLSNNDVKQTALNIYPNPVKNNVFYVNTNQNLTVNIYDVLGKLVLKSEITSNNNKVNISTLKKGVYLVNLKSDKQSDTKKLIKQ